jgi:hypothetical protein
MLSRASREGGCSAVLGDPLALTMDWQRRRAARGQEEAIQRNRRSGEVEDGGGCMFRGWSKRAVERLGVEVSSVNDKDLGRYINGGRFSSDVFVGRRWVHPFGVFVWMGGRNKVLQHRKLEVVLLPS